MKLHEKIKRIREDLDMTIQDVFERGISIFGRKSAFSYRTLQRIESGHIAKFSSVLKISYCLGITLEELIKDTEFEQRLIIRRRERLDEYTYNDKVKASIISSPSRSFLALEMKLESGGRTTVEQCPGEGGHYEKWIYVVEGELTCYLGEEKFFLKSKDTISFDSAIPHSFENRGRKTCIATVIQNPKYF